MTADTSASPRTRRVVHVVLGLIAVLLGGCGGGDSEAPPPPPAAGAKEVVLLPPRVALAEGGQGVMQALAAGRAVTWSSSDPAVATVDAAGRLQAVAPGRAVITASAGGTLASAPLTVYRSTGTTPEPSAETLIDAARAAGRLDAEQALIYRVFALFGDERLPAEFDGPPSGEPDHALLRELASTVHELSEPTQALLRPFLQAPIYADSWFARRAGLDAAAGGATARPAHAGRTTAASVECEAGRLPEFFPQVSTEHFNIFYMKTLDAQADATSAQVVAMIASFIEQDFATQTALLRRSPIADDTEPCHGGDAKVDIYYGAFALFGTGAWTRTYPLPRGTRGVNACALRPSVVMLNKASVEFLAIERALEQGRPLARSIVAHELLHVLQFAMPRQASCADTLWFDEATAQWMMDHVVPTIAKDLPGEYGLESGLGRVAPALPKSGGMLADYLLAGHMVPIEHPGASVKRNGYADYLFFQYLARAQSPDRIRQIFDALAGGQGSVESVAAAVDLKSAWPDFARTLWIGTQENVLDYWATEDEYRFGLAAIYAGEPLEGVPPQRRDKLKTLPVDQQGARRATIRLLDNALGPAGYEIPPRSLFYEHLKFSDASVHSVYLSNPIGALPDREFIKLQALRKIGGEWQVPEDWTAEPYKQFCLDQKDERVEELLLIVSNSEARRGTEQPFLIPAAFPLQIATSNVGCWAWLGTAQTTTTSGAPYRVDALARATDLYFRVRAVLPGRVSFGTVAGTVSARRTSTSFDGSCTLTQVGASKSLYLGLGGENAPPGDDGTLDIDLDLDQGFGSLPGAEPPDRALADLRGTTLLETTGTAVCPSVTTTNTAVVPWDWLAIGNPRNFAVSADGRTVEGRVSTTDGNGATSITTWTFTALRQ